MCRLHARSEWVAAVRITFERPYFLPIPLPHASACFFPIPVPPTRPRPAPVPPPHHTHTHQFVIGWTFHKGAYRALRRGRANMDVLVSVGTNAGRLRLAAAGGSWRDCSAVQCSAVNCLRFCSIVSHCRHLHYYTAAPRRPPAPAAFIYSLISMAVAKVQADYHSRGTFFETSSLLITFICLGKYLEAAATGRTSAALSELLKLAPATAILCSTDDKVGGPAGGELGVAAGVDGAGGGHRVQGQRREKGRT